MFNYRAQPGRGSTQTTADFTLGVAPKLKGRPSVPEKVIIYSHVLYANINHMTLATIIFTNPEVRDAAFNMKKITRMA